jgi:hypothetical protein
VDVRLNRPRVFLSHSKADVEFIQRLYEDLRHCQIEPWLDSEDIRHGRPWLDAIFEGGIPACDAVMVYFTESSIESTMVKKEMDAAILQQLRDKRVAFLPYIDQQSLRRRLRADIQAVQVLEWNESNYERLLPSVVAEIWRSYLERTLASSLQEERVKRLEAELELKKRENAGSAAVFSPSEEAEFSHIWARLDRFEHIEAQEYVEQRNPDGRPSPKVVLGTYDVAIQLGSLAALVIKVGYEYSLWDVRPFLSDCLKTHFSASGLQEDVESCFDVTKIPDVSDELLMYGLLERIYEPPRQENNSGIRSALWPQRPTYRHVWTAKSFRLRYWLAFRDALPSLLSIGPVSKVAET